jgi:hypothetical protein
VGRLVADYILELKQLALGNVRIETFGPDNLALFTARHWDLAVPKTWLANGG